MRLSGSSTWALAAFGLLALAGLILLAAVNHLTDALTTALVSIITGAFGALAGSTYPARRP